MGSTDAESVNDLHVGHPTYSTAQIRQVLHKCSGDQGRADDWLTNDTDHRHAPPAPTDCVGNC